jgi:hypothetical protein
MAVEKTAQSAEKKRNENLKSCKRRLSMPKKLQKQIEKKLDKLFEILGNIEEVHIINPDDPET